MTVVPVAVSTRVRAVRSRLSGPRGLLALVGIIGAVLVLPPVGYLIVTSLSLEQRYEFVRYTTMYYHQLLSPDSRKVFGNTVIFALSSSVASMILGVVPAWLVARTDAPLRRLAYFAAFLSLAMPGILKVIAWLLLVGPKAGALTTLLERIFGLHSPPFNIYSMPGMIFLQAVSWSPVVFLLTVGPFSYMDQSLEDAAAMSGARWRQILRRVTLPLSAPTLLGVFVLSLISGLEAFEVPLLVGIPAGTEVVSTHIYRLSYVSLFPSQSASSAFSVALIVIVLALIVPYHRATRRGSRYTVIGGKGYRPRRLPLGRWRWLGGAILLIQPLLLLAPLLLLLWTSFLRYYISPSEPHLPSLTFENYVQVVRFPGLGSAVMHSVTASVVAATAVLVLCMVAGWGISRAKARWGTAVDAIYSVPLVFPGIVLSLALFTMSLDIPNPIYGTVWIISLAYIIHYLPYGMRYAHPAFLSVHVDLEDTARVAGATTRSIFVRILAPLLRPSVLALWLYVFLLSVHELSIPIMLVGPNSHVISTATLDMWNDGQLTIVAAFTSLLAVVLTLLALALQKLAARVGLLG